MANKEKKGVRLEHISKIYKDPKTGKDFYAVNDVSLTIEPGSFVTLLGPSGCGKTTTLRIIGGFLTPTSGDVLFDGVRINDVPPHKRQVNTVFQKYALFPHLNVFENVAFGLRIPKTDENGKKVKIPEKEITERVMEMLEVVNLKGFEPSKNNLIPNLKYIKMFRDLGGEIITVGSDGHDNDAVGKYVTEATEIVKEAGFNYVAKFRKMKPTFERI